MLESLKQENVKDFDKEREVERVLGMITGEQFFQLFSLWKKITDWAGNGDKDVGVDPDMERKDVKIDNEVAVVFEEEEGDAEGYRVRKECSGNEDDGNNDDAHETDVDTPVDNSLLIGEETVTAKISLRSSSTIRFTTSSRFSSKIVALCADVL